MVDVFRRSFSGKLGFQHVSGRKGTRSQCIYMRTPIPTQKEYDIIMKVQTSIELVYLGQRTKRSASVDRNRVAPAAALFSFFSSLEKLGSKLMIC